MAIVSRRSIKTSAIFSAIGMSDCMALSPRPPPTLAQHAKHSYIRARELFRQTLPKFFGVALAQRIDHQADFNFLVAAAQLFFHRHRLTGRIDRGPDFRS